MRASRTPIAFCGSPSSSTSSRSVSASIGTAAGTLRDLRIAEVVKLDVKIEDGKVLEFRTRLQLSFKYES